MQENILHQRKKDLGEDGIVMGRIDRSPYQKLIVELADPQRFLIDFCSNPDPAEKIMETFHKSFQKEQPVQNYIFNVGQGVGMGK